jgi:adenylyltransferase/sulfurtransferase
VFNLKKEEGTFTANYRDLYPTPPTAGSVPSCSEVGVIGVLPGIIGAMQANEVLKIILQKEGVLAEKLLHLNSLTMDQMILGYSSNPELSPITKLIDYYEFCGVSKNKIESISFEELESLMNSKDDIQLIDVRTEQEHQAGNYGGVNIPLDEIEERIDELSLDLKTVLYCRSGARSHKAAEILLDEGLMNVMLIKQ